MFSFAPYNKTMFSVLVILSQGSKKCCPKVWMLSMELSSYTSVWRKKDKKGPKVWMLSMGRRQPSSYTSVSSHRKWNRWENSISSQWSSSHNWRKAVSRGQNWLKLFPQFCNGVPMSGGIWQKVTMGRVAFKVPFTLVNCLHHAILKWFAPVRCDNKFAIVDPPNSHT